jgi:predicted nucleic acid-binding protein
VPEAVQREVNRKGRFRYRLNKLYSTRTFQRCAAGDEWNIRLLLNELDEGEAEALAQGSEKGAHYFISDDARAREIGQKKGLKPVGTVRLLARLHLDGLAPETKVLVRKLRADLRFRVSEQVVDGAIAIAPQPI